MKKPCFAFARNGRIQSSLTSFRNNPPLLLLLITVVAYGLFAFQQGFAWDDWVFAWMPRFSGIAGLHRYYSIDRPILAYLFGVTTSLIGPYPVAWQLFALIWRATSAIALWCSLGQVWPEDRWRNFSVASLVLLYPGFSQHSIAIAYGHYSLLQTAFWISVGLMIAGVRKGNWMAVGTSVLLAAWQLFSAEYFFGLEVLRPIFLWIAFSALENRAERLKRTVLAFLPFLLVDLGFLYWRIFVFGFNSYQPGLLDDLQRTSSRTLSYLVIAVPTALYTTIIKAWFLIFHFPSLQQEGIKVLAVYLLLIAGVFSLLIYSLPKQASNPASLSTPQWILAAVLSLLTAGIPFYITKLRISLEFPNNRFTMPFAFGSAILLVLLLERIPARVYRSLALSLIAALAAGTQFLYAAQFRNDWELQKSFFSQMVWRIPALAPGTTFVSDDSAIRFSTDSSLTFPINWIYNPQNANGQIRYNYFYISSRLHGQLPALEKGRAIETSYRVAVFHGSTDRLVLLQFSPPSCLHILDPQYHKDIPPAPGSDDVTRFMLTAGVPLLTRREAQALDLSNTAQILAGAQSSAVLPEFIFGREIGHGWCFYFEKADLARQGKDWEQVASIGDSVFAIPYYPADASEYLPFVEAYARVGRLKEARDLTLKAANAMSSLRPALCSLWLRVEQSSKAQADHQFIDKVKREINYCPIEHTP